MSPRHRASRAAIELLKRFEGCRLRAVSLPDGRWMIGHGHTRTAREGAEITVEDAEALLVYDLMATARAVNDLVYAPLTQNQFDALCAFAFNIGLENFRASGALRRLNEGQHLQAAFAMEAWRRADLAGETIVVDALVRRRAAEKALFLTPPGGAFVPAPSPLLRPLLDPEARAQAPNERPVAVRTEMNGEQLLALREEWSPPSTPVDESEADDGPITAAAEAVQARLEILFREPDEPPAAQPEPEPDPGPEQLPQAEATLERRPQADFAPPITTIAEPPEPPASAAEFGPPVVGDESVTEAAGPVAKDPVIEPAEAPAEPDPLLVPTEGLTPYTFRRSIDMAPKPSATGLASTLALATIGLAFFAGGLFWGFNAMPTSLDSFVTPQIVGWLAALAGTLMFCIAAFILLQRLGKAEEAALEAED